MIDQATIDRLRRATGETEDTYSDTTLDALWLENGSDFNLTVAVIWEEKAAKAAGLVDVSEGQSSRRMSQVREGAEAMASMYRSRFEGTTGRARVVARTRPIERV